MGLGFDIKMHHKLITQDRVRGLAIVLEVLLLLAPMKDDSALVHIFVAFLIQGYLSIFFCVWLGPRPPYV